MNEIARCDCLLERVRWSHLARLGLPASYRKKNFSESHIINPLLTKFVLLRWLDVGLVLFLRVYATSSKKILTNELAKKAEIRGFLRQVFLASVLNARLL